ncbi:flagellar protein FlgN [Marinicrinis sediminis]|uniref:Flagellar protein FlgN n=1 Tax=Marinicrinis sediminis TaxID=1652465 RepID=A0ABW5RAG0_9BACL
MQAIIASLDQLIKLHQALMTLAEVKKEAIMNNDVTALNQTVQKEQKLMKAIVEAEQHKSEAIEQYMQGRNLPITKGMTLSQLLKFVFQQQDRTDLGERQERLAALLNQLKEKNDLNQQLLKQSLAFIHFSLDLLTGSDEDDVVYQNPAASSKDQKRKGIFDTKA